MPRLAVALALIERAGRWLVARRHAEAHLGGLWEFPGGKIEAGESPEVAAVREALEECAVVVEALERFAAVEAPYSDRHVTLTPVVCRWVEGEPKAVGSAEVRWCTSAELTQLAFPRANAQVIRALSQRTL